MRSRLYANILVLAVVWSLVATASGQSDASAAAARAYREKNYPEYLKNVRELSKQHPQNVWVTEFLARAYALNQMGEEAVDVLRTLAQMGVAVDTAHADLSSLKERPDFEQLRSAFDRNAAPNVRSKVAFTLAEKDLIPEGITYDATKGDFYVSSIYRRKIVRITKSGKIEDFTSPSQDGLLNVLGMKVDAKRRILWACTFSGPRDGNRDGVGALFKYDLTSGKLIRKYESASDGRKHLYNDIAITQSGDAFITDSSAGAVLRLPRATDTIETLVAPESFIYPNGIALSSDERYLFVADGRGLHRIEVKSKEVKKLAHAEIVSLAGIDGLYWYGGGLIGVQNGFKPNRIVHFKLNNALDYVPEVVVLESNHPQYEIPTTGVVARGSFYYIANSQLRKLNEREEIAPPEKLKEPIILALPLAKP